MIFMGNRVFFSLKQNRFKPGLALLHNPLTERNKLNKTDKIISQARKEGRKVLLEPEAKTICMEYGIPVTKFNFAKTEKEAVSSRRKSGFQ